MRRNRLVTSRFNSYFGIRTAKGDTGYVPAPSIVLLKDQPGTSIAKPASEPPARERTPYDPVPPKPTVSPALTAPSFILVDNTPIRVKVSETISCGTVHVDEPVPFESVDDVLVDGVLSCPRDPKLLASSPPSSPKKRFGHLGKLDFSITSMRLADGDLVPVRCYQQFLGSSHNSPETALPIYPGGDAVVAKDAEFTVFVTGDLPLKRGAFTSSKESSAAGSGSPTQAPQS
jgi:hypothetical protein